MKPRVLVTGYGGFLGSAVCKWLLNRGYRVRGIARNEYAELKQLGVEPIVGDLRDESRLGRACEGVDGIIHTAALAGVWGRREDYESINVVATRLLLQEAEKKGIGCFVYSSSPSVTFDGAPQSGIDESVPYPKGWLCDYPRTKAIAEQEVLAASQVGKLRSCSLRPHLIWGPGDPHLIPRVIDRCRNRKLRRVGSGKNRIDTVHVDSAAESHGLAFEKLLEADCRIAGRPYFITDGAPLECWDWVCQILKLDGLKPPSGSISLPVAYGIGWMLEKIYRISGRAEEPPMTRFVALQLGVDHFFSIDAAKRDLGYSPMKDRPKKMEELQEDWDRRKRAL